MFDWNFIIYAARPQEIQQRCRVASKSIERRPNKENISSYANAVGASARVPVAAATATGGREVG